MDQPTTEGETSEARAGRHAREIQDIADQGHADGAHKSGRELIAVRERTSRLIREACTRHVVENNTVAQPPSIDEPAPPAAVGQENTADVSELGAIDGRKRPDGELPPAG